MTIPPGVFIAFAVLLVLAFIALLFWALCITAAEADREPYDAALDLVDPRYAELDAYLNGPCPHCPPEPLRLDEEMLSTWDEICDLPEVQP